MGAGRAGSSRTALTQGTGIRASRQVPMSGAMRLIPGLLRFRLVNIVDLIITITIRSR